jgi:hypothetical protein
MGGRCKAARNGLQRVTHSLRPDGRAADRSDNRNQRGNVEVRAEKTLAEKDQHGCN